MIVQEKKLIFEDTKFLDSQLKDLTQRKPLLQNLRNAYEATGLGDFDDAVLKHSVDDPEFYRPIYRQSIERQLDKMKVSIPSMRKNFIEVSNKELTEFLTAAFELKDFAPKRFQTENYPVLPLSSISFDGKDFIISDEEKERLKEQARIYIETEEEQQLYEAMENLKPAYKAFFDALKQSGILPRIRLFNSHFVNLEVLFSAKEDGSLEINPGIFTFIKNHNKYKKS